MRMNMKKTSRILITLAAAAAAFATFSMVSFAATTPAATGASVFGIGEGVGLIAAALSTGLSGIGAAIALAGGIPAAIGALAEDDKTFGKALIFVALGEGIALYGMLISILILNKI